MKVLSACNEGFDTHSLTSPTCELDSRGLGIMDFGSFITAALILSFFSCSAASNALELLNKLLANTTVDIRPGLEEDTPLVVNISFNIVALNKLNEVEGYIATTGYLEVSWWDYRMMWDPSLYDGIDFIAILPNKVWTPDIVVSNPADKIYSFNDITTRVTFFKDGSALWMPGSVMKTICFIRIPAYPFDVHKCYIEIVLWGYQTYEVILQNPYDKVVWKYYSENSEWALTDTSVMFINKGTYIAGISFGLEFSRKPTFLIVNVLIPIVFLSILNSFVFLLPQQSGERVSFSVTVLLSFTVFLNVIGDNVPKTSSPMPFLCHYVVIVLITSGLITLLAILCQRFYHTHGDETVPRWLLSLLCMAPNRVVTAEEERRVHDSKTYMNSPEPPTMKQVILKLDKLLFLFFFVLDIALALGFIITMSRRTG